MNSAKTRPIVLLIVAIIALAASLMAISHQKARLGSRSIDANISRLRDLIKQHPHEGFYHQQLSMLLSMQGKKTEAVKEIKLALRLDPDFAGNWYVQAGIQEATRHYSEALRSYLKAIDLMQCNKRDICMAADYYYSAARMYEKLGKNIPAINYYQKALDSLSLPQVIERHPSSERESMARVFKSKIAELKRRK